MPVNEARVQWTSADGTVVKGRVAAAPNPPVAPAHRRAVVLTHPYGPLGGNMDNNVVRELFAHFALLGHTVVRFNFRPRTSWTAAAEGQDLAAVLAWLAAQPPCESIAVVGYSYGAMVAGALAETFPAQVKALVLISYPFSVTWALSLFSDVVRPLGKSPLPKLCVMGSRDNFTSVERLGSAFAGFAEPKTKAIVDGVDHFWDGSEAALASQVQSWLSSVWG